MPKPKHFVVCVGGGGMEGCEGMHTPLTCKFMLADLLIQTMLAFNLQNQTKLYIVKTFLCMA